MNREGAAPSGPRILVPLDGSPLAELALAEALALVQLPNTEVMFLQVVPPLGYLRTIAARPEWHGASEKSVA